MRNTLDGSRIERGRKNRRNIRKHVVRNPATLAQTIRRRILLTGGSGVLSTTAPGAFGGVLLAASAGFAAAGVPGADGPAPLVPPGVAGVVTWLPDTSGLP